MEMSDIKTIITTNVKPNGKGEITGEILQGVLVDMVDDYNDVVAADVKVVSDALATEIAERKAADNLLNESLTTEIASRTSADNTLTTKITDEGKERIAADEALSVRISSEASTRAAVDKSIQEDVTTLQTDLGTETTERKAADDTLTKDVSTLKVDLASEIEARKNKDTELSNSLTAVSTDLLAEVDARTEGDTTLDGKITAEASTRKSADEALDARITAEATTRKTDDEALDAKISTEATTRKTDDEALDAKISAEASTRETADEALSGSITTNANAISAEVKNREAAVKAITDKIPTAASSTNQLADKDFVNSSIATSTATFRGTFTSLDELKKTTADKNDYAFYEHNDAAGNTLFEKYTYDGTEWKYEYTLNNSSFTAAQWSAINSGITADKISALETADTTNANAISAEAKAREAEDNALDGKITTEATTRENADKALDGKITTEATARENADKALDAKITTNADAISAEAKARAEADEALSGRITTNADTISAESSAREAADGVLDKKIEEEIVARAGAIKDEADAREAGDAEVLSKILPFCKSLTYAELKALRDASGLVAGQWYRITDFVTTTAQAETQSAGHPFDIIVRADTTSILNEKAYATHHEGDEYFTKAKLEAWELKYCLDNDTTRFAWADTTNGKGVIHYMEDEFGNELSYDFKNIQFKLYKATGPEWTIYLSRIGYTEDKVIPYRAFANGSPFSVGSEFIWAYTFSAYESGATFDKTMEIDMVQVTSQDIPTNNKIGEALETLRNDDGNVFSRSFLSFNVWIPLLVYTKDDAFGVYSNVLGDNCLYNTFGNNCYSNTFGDSCNSNTFGNSCRSNTFGNSCYYNTFGNSCYYNTFGNSCNSNTFGNNCYYNTFGNNCYSNRFGYGCSYNTFGNNCYSNRFGTSSAVYNYMYFCALDNGVGENTFAPTTQGTSSTYFQNVHIKRGVKSQTISIDSTKFPNGSDYEWTIAMNSSGELVQYCADDRDFA